MLARDDIIELYCVVKVPERLDTELLIPVTDALRLDNIELREL